MNDMQRSDHHLSSLFRNRPVRVSAGARLHFGLLDSVEPFGGLGTMVDSPGTEVTASESDQFKCDELHRGRFEEIARRVADYVGLGNLPALKLDVQTEAEAHCGLGSGTQLALAATEAMLSFLGAQCTPIQMARDLAGRGKRSAVGIHGYFNGGMIFEASSISSAELNPIKERVELPTDWCVAVLKPSMEQGQVFGPGEVEKFSRLPAGSEELRSTLDILAQKKLLPAAREHDFHAFSDALQHYNRTSGLLFSSIQGGPYNGPEVSSLIDWLTQRGVVGVGQSSWGPGVFAWFESQGHAETLVERLPSGATLLTLTRIRVEPRKIEFL